MIVGFLGSVRARAVAGVSALAIALVAFGASPLGAKLSEAANSEALQTTVEKTEEKKDVAKDDVKDDTSSSASSDKKAESKKSSSSKSAEKDTSSKSSEASSGKGASSGSAAQSSTAQQQSTATQQSDSGAASSSQQSGGSQTSAGSGATSTSESASSGAVETAPSNGGGEPSGTKVDEAQLTPSAPATFEVNVTIDATPAGGEVIYRVVTLEQGQTAYDALVATGANVNARGTIYGIYVSAINGLAEMQYGSKSGWVYAVDGVQPNVACSATVMSAGQTLVWTYVNVEP